MALRLNPASVWAIGVSAVAGPGRASPSRRISSITNGDPDSGPARSTTASMTSGLSAANSSEWVIAPNGSTGSKLIAASPAAGITANVSTAAGPSAARAPSMSALPSLRSPQWQPRTATNDLPRNGSGMAVNGGKLRKVTAEVSSGGAERDQSAKNSSTSLARPNG